MIQSILRWADPFAMVASLIITFVLTTRTIKRSGKSLRSFALFFALFGPVVIAVHMGMHLLATGLVAFERGRTGHFEYNFRFYSLVLMGGVIGWLSTTFLVQCMGYICSGVVSHKSILKTMGWIALVSIPAVPFTPIASLPAMACFISLIALRFVYKQKQQSVVASIAEESLAMPA